MRPNLNLMKATLTGAADSGIFPYAAKFAPGLQIINFFWRTIIQ
jgi:hypothetical protein